jgi:hypothetical protein
VEPRTNSRPPWNSLITTSRKRRPATATNTICILRFNPLNQVTNLDTSSVRGPVRFPAAWRPGRAGPTRAASAWLPASDCARGSVFLRMPADLITACCFAAGRAGVGFLLGARFFARTRAAGCRRTGFCAGRPVLPSSASNRTLAPPRVMTSPDFRTSSSTCLPFSMVPLELPSSINISAPPLARMLMCWREIPGSGRTTSFSMVRPTVISIRSKVKSRPSSGPARIVSLKPNAAFLR